MSLRQSGAASDGGKYALDWTRLAAEFRQGPDGWHGVVALGGATHRLYVPAMPPMGASLSIELPLEANADIRLQAARRFWCAIDGRRLGPSPLALSSQRRRRFMLMMRALDGWLAGRSYREIAEGLFGKECVGGRSWKGGDLRSRIIRLVKSGIDLMRGGYRSLLRTPPRKR